MPPVKSRLPARREGVDACLFSIPYRRRYGYRLKGIMRIKDTKPQRRSIIIATMATVLLIATVNYVQTDTLTKLCRKSVFAELGTSVEVYRYDDYFLKIEGIRECCDHLSDVSLHDLDGKKLCGWSAGGIAGNLKRSEEIACKEKYPYGRSKRSDNLCKR